MVKTVDPPIPALRRPVQLSGLSLLALSFQTLGIIYSDIGTSPLYVLNGLWPAAGSVPPTEDVIGGISCIIWALTILPLMKYVFVALRFGTDEGEGGVFALYHGLIPPQHPTAEEDRTLTGDSVHLQSMKSSREKLLRFKWILLPWALFGTSLTMADGVFTPAVSVTSAVAGIAVADTSVGTPNKITGISIAFLAGLFMVQRFGTAKISFLFSPVTFIWLALIGVSGIINITKYPGIFRAFDPSRAVLLFVRTKDYNILAGVLLALTGCEALFANLGQFNMLSIQLSFGCYVFPALVLAYLGQGARLIVDGQTVLDNMFYQSIPGPTNGPLWWFTYVIAILATLVASQALITATFSLIQQVINMKSFPPLRMYHTSDTIQGQIYLPVVNWTLAAVIIIVVGAFQDLIQLTNAYGFAVATVMFTSTTLMALQCHYVKKLPWIVSVLFLVWFGFFDGLFWGAALIKVPLGAWVPLMIGMILLFIMWFWTWGKGLEDEFDGANRKNLRHFIVHSDMGALKLEHDSEEIEELGYDAPLAVPPPAASAHGSDVGKSLYLAPDAGSPARELAVIPILAVFHKFASGKGIPHSFVGFLKQYPALPRVAIFLSVRVMPTARVLPEDRLIVNKVRSIDGFYGVTYQIGYREDFDVDINVIVDDICALERQAGGRNPRDSEDTIRQIKEAARSATHIVPHYNVMSRASQGSGLLSDVGDLVRAVMIEEVYRRIASMFPQTANWLTRADEIIHVGVTARI